VPVWRPLDQTGRSVPYQFRPGRVGFPERYRSFVIEPTRRPLIAMSGRRWPGGSISGLPDNFADVPFDLHCGSYADAVYVAGGTPVFTPCTTAALDVLDHADGLVLTGGSDVSPARYGETPHPTVYGVDDARDEVEIALVHAALERGMPILAICRGMQILNVAVGGSLVQHLEPSDDVAQHAAWDVDPASLVHEVRFESGSVAAGCFGPHCSVNSLHHQALGRLGHGLVASGFAPDGTVEAAEMPGRPVLAVQWHPELVVAHPDPSFAWLVRAAAEAATATATATATTD
jgi:putative glutamine amidotransferase